MTGPDTAIPRSTASRPAGPDQGRAQRNRRRIAGTLDRLWPFVAVAVLIGAAAILHHELASYSFRELMAAARAVPLERLGWALGCTVLAYAVLPGYDAMALRYIGFRLPLYRTAFGSFIAYAFSQMLGFPLVTGGSVRYRLWSAWGLSTAQIARAVSFVAFSFALGMLTVSGVAFAAEPAGTGVILGLPSGSLRLLGLVNLGLVASYVWWSVRRRRSIRLGSWRIPAPSTRLVGAQLLVSTLDWTLAGAALFVLLPPGHGLTLVTFLGIFLLAQFAGLVSHVPGGLGVVETILILLLKPYLQASALLGALIVYRGVYYLLPFCVGVLLLAQYELRPYAPRALGAVRSAGAWVPRLVPQVLSGAVFLTGVILLGSGATPAIPGRLAWLGRLLPLGVIEVSHLLGSMAGVGLLVLAWALWHRLDAAYSLTVVLLAVGIGASLLKGGDWEEATVLAIVLGAVLPARRYFYRKSALAAEPLETGWLLAILAVVGGFIWLGFFAHKHAEYRNELWWRFALHADAPRFLRAAVGVVGVLVAAGLFRLFRRAPANPALPGKAELDRAASLIADLPDVSASLALVGDKALLFSESGRGLLMYGVEGRSWVALGDPLGPQADQVELVWRFRELADRQGGWTVFYEVGVGCLPLYIDLGLTLIKLGEEARVPLADFSLDGPNRRALRRSQRQMERERITFDVVPTEQVGPLLPTLRAISDAWLAEKRTREKGFSLGFFDEAYIARFPVAVARRAGEIVAFANVWASRPKVKLSMDLMRYRPDAPPGVMQYLCTELMLWGKVEGYQYFGLGMAPFSGMERRALAPLWSRLGAFMYRYGEHFYNFQGLREFKEKFDPVWEPRYLASPGGLALPRILANVAALIGGGVRGVVAK
ncbi:MAG TPA: bifunctional lysylphosphatidylglycerol flippase/synthetase MprF [Gemmatimonadales bacterium]|nr:bifunctional lysylphosphatidylglycerol flippase/synthetase MprF [Gemmatimonadales bacterium]